ncbi:MAG: hypothetical protein CMO80_13285 [Verrucomicrobiales bacterium]|nr:hypothetical protein [Verrucomicrobiales bacterium]|tara:strand:- start:83 stop:547 length:465 start_codon:yes stop_codon:yes gene_type:complete
MKLLVIRFECSVIIDTSEFAIPDDCRHHELFPCRGGRFHFALRSMFGLRHAGEVSATKWKPIDDIPPAELDANGRLKNEEETVSRYDVWRGTRWENWQPESIDPPAVRSESQDYLQFADYFPFGPSSEENSESQATRAPMARISGMPVQVRRRV